MKKLITISSLAVLLGAGSVIGYHYLFSAKSESTALQVKAFDSLNKLKQKADTIVKAKVPEEFEEVEVELPSEDNENLYQVAKIYKIEIEKSFKDAAGNKYKKGDTVDLVVPVGVKQKKNGQESEILPYRDKEVQLTEGEYILFLDSHDSKEYGKNTLFIKNYNHIYKRTEEKSLSKGKEKYKNIASDDIPSIEEADVEN